MLSLSAKNRTETGKKVKNLRAKGILPGVVYGYKIQNIPLEVDSKEKAERFIKSHFGYAWFNVIKSIVKAG